MAYLRSRLSGMLRRYLLVFGAIVLAIACGSWIRVGWKDIQGLLGELPPLQLAEASVRDCQAAQTPRTAEGLRKLSGASVRQLDARIRTIDLETGRLEAARDGTALVLAATGGPDAVAESLAQAARSGMTLACSGRKEAIWWCCAAMSMRWPTARVRSTDSRSCALLM